MAGSSGQRVSSRVPAGALPLTLPTRREDNTTLKYVEREPAIINPSRLFSVPSPRARLTQTQPHKDGLHHGILLRYRTAGFGCEERADRSGDQRFPVLQFWHQDSPVRPGTPRSEDALQDEPVQGAYHGQASRQRALPPVERHQRSVSTGAPRNSGYLTILQQQGRRREPGEGQAEENSQEVISDPQACT